MNQLEELPLLTPEPIEPAALPSGPTSLGGKELGGRHLAWNSLLNLGTAVFIAGLNVIFVPLMLHTFGTEFYGVLSVTWMVLGNFSWLDFGFSRASARYVAQELGRGRPDQAALWTCTAVVSQTFLGLIGACAIWLLAPIIVNHIHVQSQNHDLVVLTLRMFAFCIPIDFANRSITGVMQAGQRFDWVNGLGIFSTLSTFAVYGIGILHGANFKMVVYGLVIMRVVNLIGCYWGATYVLPELKSVRYLETVSASYRDRVVTLVKYGWWVASASIVAPLLVMFDQWMISILIGVSLLPFYTIPSNLLWRLAMFPNSLTTTLFPAFSAMEAKTEWSRIEYFFVRAHRYLLTALLPILFVLYSWGGEILRLWIGASFAEQATVPLQMLILGFAIGLLAPLSGALLEAVGRPDILVKLYLVELPLNVLLVWSLTKYHGIAGAALSYTVRTIIETLVLWIVVYRIVPFSGMELLKKGLLRPGAAMVFLGAASFALGKCSVRNIPQLAVTVFLLAAYCAYSYWITLDARDRKFGVDTYLAKKQKLMAKLFGQRVALEN